MEIKMTARTLQGFMELLPQEQLVFNHIKSVIAHTYEKFGFAPLDTPVLELAEVLLSKSGGETEKQIYEFTRGDTNLAMRFDLTVPLAKYVALYNNDLTFPFKRYQIGKVYRGERPQKGRFREFYQCDIDIIDRDELNIVYDAEVLAVIYTIFSELKLPSFKIYINNRKLLGGYLQHLKIADKTVDVLRLVDKIKKIPEEAFLGELKDLGLPEDKNNSLLSFIKINGLNREIIAQLESLGVENESFVTGLSELKTVIEMAQKLGMPDTNIQIDLSITRGLDYYTGTVYETFFDEYPQFGSVCSGGRYDNLSSVFMDKKFPGVGISIGLTRLFDQLRANNLLPIKALTPNKALIITQGEEYISEAVKLAGNLRKSDIPVDVMYRQCKFKKKMEYANKIGVPYLIIIGEEEVANKKYALKDMTSGEQLSLNVDELIEKLK
ncbi:MAG: histidine--tRNA ligase [Alphaproteobacteria bacterium]|nr:histidine--tRNA ligase [Alphaproteobacteria bacterium]